MMKSLCLDVFEDDSTPALERCFDIPPKFDFDLRPTGWLRLDVIGICAGETAKASVWLSADEPPLEALWTWAFLVLIGHTKLWVEIDEEDCSSYFGAWRLPDGKLELHLFQEDTDLRPRTNWRWEEDAELFISRWGLFFGNLLKNGNLRWDTWEARRGSPERGRSMPWNVFWEHSDSIELGLIGSPKTGLSGPFAFPRTWTFQRNSTRHAYQSSLLKRMHMGMPMFIESAELPVKRLRGLMRDLAASIHIHHLDVGDELFRLFPVVEKMAVIVLNNPLTKVDCPRFGTRVFVNQMRERLMRRFAGLQQRALANGRYFPPPRMLFVRVSTSSIVRVDMVFAHGFLPQDGMLSGVLDVDGKFVTGVKDAAGQALTVRLAFRPDLAEEYRRQCRVAAQADMDDKLVQQLMDETVADVDGWTA